MSKDTVEFLARFCTNTVYMVYDNDPTGRKATHGWVDDVTGKHRMGALDLLTKAGMRAVDYPYHGKDPGDVWSKRGIDGLLATFGR
jgi:DNA primase